MKPKVIRKKIVFNKVTVADLGPAALQGLKAGGLVNKGGTETCDGECTQWNSHCPINTCTCNFCEV